MLCQALDLSDRFLLALQLALGDSFPRVPSLLRCGEPCLAWRRARSDARLAPDLLRIMRGILGA